MNQPADSVLIDQILSGDTGPFEILVQRHQSYAFTIAFKIVNSREEAEEIAQDSFVKAYRNLASFNRKAKFSTWLYRIVSNTAITYLRKLKPDKESIENIGSLYDTSKRDVLEHNDRQQFINQAMERMLPEDKMVISLFYLKEMTLEEVAEITKYNISTLKVRLFRARKRMADALKDVLHKEALNL